METKVSALDLAAIAAAHPVNVRECVLRLDAFDASQLTLLEVLDMAECAEAEPQELGSLLRLPKNSARKMRLLFALAWVIARRAEPGLTFAEVCTWRLEVIGEPVERSRSHARAAAVVNAATLAGVTPKEAEQLTVAELGAYAANRAARRRKAG